MDEIVEHHASAPEQSSRVSLLSTCEVCSLLQPTLHVPSLSQCIVGVMSEKTSVRRGRHAVWDLHVHLVFVTKYRHKVFDTTHLDYLGDVMRSVCENFGCTLEEFNGEGNHVHLLVGFPATVELSKLVNSLKGVSSRRARQRFPELGAHYWRAKVLWSRSYYAGTTGGAGIDTVKRYIENQSRPDSPPA